MGLKPTQLRLGFMVKSSAPRICLWLLLILVATSCDQSSDNAPGGLAPRSTARISKITQFFGTRTAGNANGVQENRFSYSADFNVLTVEFATQRTLSDPIRTTLSTTLVFASDSTLSHQLNFIHPDVGAPIKTDSISYVYNQNAELIRQDRFRLVDVEFSPAEAISVSSYQYLHDENGRVTEINNGGLSRTTFEYGSKGNAVKSERFVPNDAGDASFKLLTTSFRFDNETNPFFRNPVFMAIRFINNHPIYHNPNNMASWESKSGLTGETLNTSVFEYQYNQQGFPVRISETVFSNTIPNSQGMEIVTEIEYLDQP